MNELRLYRAYFSTTYETQNALKVPTGWRLQFLSVLPDAISCEVREELNGQYEAEIIYPATGFQHSTYEDTSIGLEKILGIKCPLRDSISENLFRIYRVDRDLGGYFHIYARQLSYDLNHFAATKDGISAVTGGITNFADSYGVHSYGMNLRAISNMDIPFAFGGDAEYDTSITGAGFQQDWSTCTSIRAYLGGEELTGYDLSALRRFGGEFEFSRFDVNLWEERGQDRDVTVTYGTSMMGLDSVDSSEGVYNAVCCFSTETDGAYYKKHTATANCQHMGGLTYRSVKIIDCSSDVMEKYPDGATDAQIDALLLSLANEEAKRIDSPSGLTRKITIDVAESELNGVYLGDTIRVLYIRNGLSLDDRLKITSYTWDVLRQRYTSITVGPIQSSLAGEIIDAGEKSDIIALQNVAASTQNAIQELQARYVAKAGDTMTGNLNMADGALVDGVDVSKLAMQFYDSGSQNLNDFKSRGLYYFGTGCTLSNVPNSAVNGWLTVIDNGLGVCKQYWHRHGSIPTTFKDEYFRYYNSSAWSDWIRVGLYDDIGIIHLGVISISGQLSAVGSWIKSNFIASRWISARVNATASGYFGTSGFCINANLSSQNYGWGWLQSDQANMILFFRVSAGTFYWWHPTMTQVSG